MLSDDPIISKVILRYKYWPKRKDYIPPVERVSLERELSQDVENKQDKPGILAIVRYLYNIAKGLIMKDWKTTVTGVIGAAVILVNHFTGVQIPEAPLTAIVVAIIGWLSGDSQK